MKPTRYYSSKQEEYVAKLVNGKTVPGSGSPHFCCGDVVTKNWLFECKTTTKPKESFSIKKEWLDKNEKERMGLQKLYSALVFQFKEDGTNYFVINESLFKEMMEVFNGE